jgi:hypothetical protein
MPFKCEIARPLFERGTRVIRAQDFVNLLRRSSRSRRTSRGPLRARRGPDANSLADPAVLGRPDDMTCHVLLSKQKTEKFANAVHLTGSDPKGPRVGWKAGVGPSFRTAGTRPFRTDGQL